MAIGRTNSGSGGAAKVKLSGLIISMNPTKMTYEAGETFDPSGMIVVAQYNDGSTSAVFNYTYPTSALKISDKNIQISYTEDGITQIAILNIAVKLTVYNRGSGAVTIKGGSETGNYVNMRITGAGEGKVFSTNKIDITGASKIKALVQRPESGIPVMKLGITANTPGNSAQVTSFAAVATETLSTQNLEYTLECGFSQQGEYHAIVASETVGARWWLYEMWFE